VGGVGMEPFAYSAFVSISPWEEIVCPLTVTLVESNEAEKIIDVTSNPIEKADTYLDSFI